VSLAIVSVLNACAVSAQWIEVEFQKALKYRTQTRLAPNEFHGRVSLFASGPLLRHTLAIGKEHPRMRHSSRRVRVASIALFALTGAASPGCLISSHSQESRTGTYVSENTFDQIKPGETTAGWVLATLGEPSSKSSAEGRVIWKYAYTERRDSGGAIFLIFGSSKTTETEHTAFVELKDGVVVNKWRS